MGYGEPHARAANGIMHRTYNRSLSVKTASHEKKKKWEQRERGSVEQYASGHEISQVL